MAKGEPSRCLRDMDCSDGYLISENEGQGEFFSDEDENLEGTRFSCLL